jgi:hypothetical protein
MIPTKKYKDIDKEMRELKKEAEKLIPDGLALKDALDDAVLASPQLKKEADAFAEKYFRILKAHKKIKADIEGLYNSSDYEDRDERDILDLQRWAEEWIGRHLKDAEYLIELTESQQGNLEKNIKREEGRLMARVRDLGRRVYRAKSDKELEALALELGEVRAHIQAFGYGEPFNTSLDTLEREISSEYSVVGKGMRFLKKLFSRGKRASQIRVASQMNRELQREIRALKRDLNK